MDKRLLSIGNNPPFLFAPQGSVKFSESLARLDENTPSFLFFHFFSFLSFFHNKNPARRSFLLSSSRYQLNRGLDSPRSLINKRETREEEKCTSSLFLFVSFFFIFLFSIRKTRAPSKIDGFFPFLLSLSPSLLHFFLASLEHHLVHVSF